MSDNNRAVALDFAFKLADLNPGAVDIISAAEQFLAFLEASETKAIPKTPAISIKKSVQPDYIVCLDDGRKLKMLTRHITRLGYTPQSYRAHWGLPPDYPMTAPNYSAQRSEFARSIGLGHLRTPKPAPPAQPAASPRRRGRPARAQAAE